MGPWSFISLMTIHQSCFWQVCLEAEAQLRQLKSIQEELSKFDEELSTFENWMTEAEEKLRTEQKKGGDPDQLKSLVDEHKVRRH